MKILPNSNINQNNYQFHTNFGTSKNVRVLRDNSIICNITWPFRECLDWKGFVKLLANKYNSSQKVNVLDLACSDGSESVTLLTSLYEFLESDVEKFLPIKASDKTKNVIDCANSGIYNIEEHDLRRINMVLNHYSDYFYMTSATSKLFPFGIKLLPKYSGKIIYEQMDIFDALKNLQLKNNVILCRNVLPYLSFEKRVEFVDELAKRLDSTSLVVIGSFDNGHDVDNLIKSRGFKQTNVENVYSKS